MLALNRVCRRLKIDHICYTRKIAGREIRIAVLDSGIAGHPFLQGCVAEFQDFTKASKREAYDDNGHGCHVGGILHRIAPAAQLMVGKVLDGDGKGDLEQAIQGMEWILNRNKDHPIHILNLSLGLNMPLTAAKQKRLNDMMQELNEEGIVVVCAAGNHCKENDRKHIRGKEESALLVGCLASGPCYPDVVAPGEGIVSCDTERGYVVKSGSSMATPVVSGVLALALEGRGRIPPYDMYRYVKETATNLGYSQKKQGYGMIHPQKLLEVLDRVENV